MTRRIISKDVLASAIGKYGNLTDQLFFGASRIPLCIDSRVLEPGDIFLAIRGDLDDGHKYIGDAIQKGARLIIAETSRQSDFASQKSTIFVDDSLRFLGEIARAHLARISVKKIAVTGSNGKTTTKEMIKAALSTIAGINKVYGSPGNKNNLFGLPLCALEITEDHQYAIFEMGMNQVGEMARLCSIVIPDVGAITNISGAHAGNFENGIDGIRHEKGQLFQSLAESDGIAIINLDDENVLKESERPLKTRVTFGRAHNANVRFVDHSRYSLSLGAQTVTLVINGCQQLDVLVPLAGFHHAMNAACALTVINALGLPMEQGSIGIKNMTKIVGRMSVVCTKNGQLLINDGYNANPVSMEAGIMASREFPAERRIAAIGGMGELGKNSDYFHLRLGELLARNFDHLFICGEVAFATVEGAKRAGMDHERIVYRNSAIELIEPLKTFLQKGDLIFIKGSLPANMQVIVTAISDGNGLCY